MDLCSTKRKNVKKNFLLTTQFVDSMYVKGQTPKYEIKLFLKIWFRSLCQGR